MKNIFSLVYWKAIALLVFTANARANRNNFLGSVWVLIQPFVHIVVISFFFSFLLKVPSRDMVGNLVGSLPLWGFLTASLTQAANAFVMREAILKRTIISKTYFPVADVLYNLYQMFLSFSAMYFGMVLFFPDKFSLYIIFMPIMALPLIISVVVLGTALAYITPYIRDVPRLIEVLLSVLYWTIPIIYPYSLIPESKRVFFEWNPLYILIKPVQDLVITGYCTGPVIIVKSWVVSILCVIFSYFVVKKLAKRVIYYI